MQERLTAADVEQLLSEPREEARAEAALKVAAQFRNVVLTPRERELAEEILGYLVHDVALHVRLALSRCLCDLAEAPHSIILALARDIDEIALPVLESSSVLTDDDLVEIVLGGSAQKQRAVARRQQLAAPVSEAIVWAGDRQAVLVLVANEGAVIRPDLLNQLADRYAGDEEVLDPMASRKDLPAALVERLVTMVSDRLRSYLIERHRIDAITASLLDDLARERAVIDLLAKTNPNDVSRLVAQVHERGRLGASLLLRALCSGELAFAEAGFALLTEVPQERVVRLIHDIGPLGFRAVYARASLPEVYYPAFRAALDVIHELQDDGYFSDRPFLRHRMLERIEARYVDIEAEEIDLLIDRLARFARALPWQAGHAA